MATTRVLHTVNKPVSTTSCFDSCLSVCLENDAVVLIENGVYCALANTTGHLAMQQHGNILFYALESDVLARGITDKLCKEVTLINETEFVGLVTTHKSVQSWY